MATTYTTHEITVKGNIWGVTIATGDSNYVAVRKNTNNPYATLGKEFESLTAASNHYKDPEMKIALLQIELNEQDQPAVDYVAEAKDCIAQLEYNISVNEKAIANPYQSVGHKAFLKNVNNAYRDTIEKLTKEYLQ